MLALAVLDLPFEPTRPRVEYEGGRMTPRPGGRLIPTHEEVRPADGPGGEAPIPVRLNVYRSTGRFRAESGERLGRFVTDKFVAHTTYGCRAVVTNPTSTRQRLSVLVQLPKGACRWRGEVHPVSERGPGAVPDADGRLPVPRPAAGHVPPLPGSRAPERAVPRIRPGNAVYKL